MSDTEVRFELERAITENELVLHFQPRVLLSDMQLRGVEVLVRWRHPTRGIVSSAEFITAAEQAGLMQALESWVIRETLLQAAVWRTDGVRVGVSVNLGALLLRDEPFLRRFEHTLKMHGDPGTFIFEVSAASLAGVERPEAGLARLRGLGVHLALDDVTASGELEAASWTRWDYVKLGRRLVTDVSRDGAAEATLRALVARSTALGARVIAVGAEDEAALALLRDAGAYSVQGFVIAPALGAKELWAWSEGRRRLV